jgi:uncharacterized membrane protein YfcA
VIFPVAGVHLPLWLPPLIAFTIGLLCAPAGVSGAFLLLPLQVSLLGFTSPAVTPTNFLYNVVGIPGGVLRYRRDGRLDGTLAATLTAGLVPGSFLGMLVHLFWLTDARRFKLYIAAVLLLLTLRLLLALRGRGRPVVAVGEDGLRACDRAARVDRALPPGARVRVESRSWRRVEASLGDARYAYDPLALAGLGLLMGVVGGAYGIGGGAMMAPLLIGVFRLPVHAIAGANLAGTLAASVAGVFFYAVVGPALAGPGTAVGPDWALGLLFGAGGLAGLYCGASLQRFLPARPITIGLAALLFLLVVVYGIPVFA